MPFPSFKSKKPASLSPEITSQTRPLVYAQSTYAPSEVDSINTSTQRSPDIRPPTHKAISSDVFADVTYYKEQKAKQAAAAAEAGEVDSSVDDETQQTPAFERPTTPPQGSRSLPWESYRDLEADHPVFLYPDDVREKMYAKGIDPVIRAMADKSLRGKVYGEKNKPGKGFYKRGLSMMNQFGTMSIGATN